MTHLDPDTLTLLAFGEEQPDAPGHLEDCEVCARELASLRRVVLVGRQTRPEDLTPAPPASVWARITQELGVGTAPPPDPALAGRNGHSQAHAEEGLLAEQVLSVDYDLRSEPLREDEDPLGSAGYDDDLVSELDVLPELDLDPSYLESDQAEEAQPAPGSPVVERDEEAETTVDLPLVDERGQDPGATAEAVRARHANESDGTADPREAEAGDRAETPDDEAARTAAAPADQPADEARPRVEAAGEARPRVEAPTDGDAEGTGATAQETSGADPLPVHPVAAQAGSHGPEAPGEQAPRDDPPPDQPDALAVTAAGSPGPEAIGGQVPDDDPPPDRPDAVAVAADAAHGPEAAEQAPDGFAATDEVSSTDELPAVDPLPDVSPVTDEPPADGDPQGAAGRSAEPPSDEPAGEVAHPAAATVAEDPEEVGAALPAAGAIPAEPASAGESDPAPPVPLTRGDDVVRGFGTVALRPPTERDDLSAPPAPGARRRSRARAKRRRRTAVLSGLGVVVALAVAAAFTLMSPRDRVVAEVDLAPLEDSEIEGTAQLVERGGELELRVDLAAPARSDGYYELWLIDEPGDRLVSLGPVTGDGSYRLPPGLPVEDYPVVDVSDEPYDGDPEHSGDSLARGTLSV